MSTDALIRDLRFLKSHRIRKRSISSGTGEISDRFAIYFVPAGYVFAIWGVIYLGMIAYTVYQALPAQRDNPLLNKIAPAYWIGNLSNIAWIFLWHYEFFPLTLVAMLTLLAGRGHAARRVEPGDGAVVHLVRAVSDAQYAHARIGMAEAEANGRQHSGRDPRPR